MVTVVEAVTGNDAVLLDGLRPVLTSAGFRALGPDALRAEVESWVELEYADVFSKGVEFDGEVTGAPQVPDALTTRPADWAEATDLGDLPSSLPRMSSAGEAGSVARLGPHSGAYLIERPDGSEWVVKLRPDGSGFRAQAIAEYEGLLGAAATGYGPTPYGLVRATIAGQDYAGVAMAQAPGGFIGTSAVDPAETEQWRAAVTFDTVRQYDQYLQRLLDAGYYVRTDLQVFVDGDGNLRPIDFEFVAALPADPAARRTAIENHGTGSFIGRAVRRQLLDAAVANARRHQGDRSLLAATDAVVEDGLPLQERETIAREAFARLKLPKHVLDRIELVTPPTQDAFYQRYRQVERITELRRGHFQPNPDGSAELVITLDANPTRAAILETVLHEAAHLVFAASSPVEQLQLQNDIDRIPGTPLVRQWRQEITELYAGASRHLVNEELLARAYAHIVEEFGDMPSAVRTWLDGVVTGTFGRICVRLGLVSPETLRDARTRRDHDLAPFYRVLRTALQGRQRAIHPANYHQTRASLGSEQSDSFAQAVRRSGGALQVVVDVRDAPATDTAHPTLEGARVQRQLAAAQQRLDQAIAAWNLALEQGALPDAALEKALDEAADVFVLRRDEAGRQLGRDAVLAAIRQLETTVTEDHRAFVVLTREDGSSRRLVLHNDGNRPRYVDSDQQDVERSAVLRGARSDVVSVEALVLDPAGTPVPFAGRPIGTHNEYGAETPVSPDELLHLPADHHAAVLARIERGAAMRAPADDSLVRFWSDAPALPDAIENVAAIEPVGPGWLRVTTRGGLTLLAGVRRGPVAHGEVTVERVGDTAAFVITVAQGIDRELADLTFGQLIDAELDADWVEAAAAGHIAALAAQLDIVAPVRARLQAADEAFALPPADVSLVDWSTVREALTDIRAGLDDPYQPANLALAADRLRTAHTHVPAPGALHELATGASQAAAQLGGSAALRRGYDVPDRMTPADVLTATKLQVRHRRLNAGTPDQLGRYDARRLNRRRRARLREAVSAAGLDIGAVNHFDRFRLLDRSGYGKVVELALEYGARPGLVASLPLTVDTGWLDETLRRPRFQQAVGATLVPTEKAGVVTVSVKGHDPFTLAVRLDGQEQPSADPVADVVVPFEADREADPSVHELAGRVAKAITSHLSPADRESADLLTWQALGGQAGHELGLNDQAAVGWLRSFSLHHAEPTWRDARALREFLYQKGLLPNSPDYEHKFAALQRVDGELADYVLRHNGARRVTRVRRLIETRPLGEAGIEPSRAAIPVFDGSDLVRLASWLTRFEEGPHGRRLSFARSGENTVAITVPRTDGSPDVVTVVVEPAAGLAARHGQVVRGAEASTYHLRTPPGVDRLRGERLTIEGLYAVVAEHLDSTTALPPGIAAVLARFEEQLVSAAGWRTFRMLVKDLTEHLAELGLDDHALTELDDLIPSSLRRVLTRKGRARSAQAMAEQLEERLDRGEAEPSRVPRRAIFLGGMALDKLLIGVGNAALGLALFHNSSWLGATFAIGYGLAEGCGQGYLMYRGQLAGEKLEQAVRGRGAALRAERETAQAALLRDDVRDVIRPLLENVVRVPSAEPARPTPTARRWSAYDSEPWVLQRSQRYHLWSNLPYGVMSTIEPVALVGAGAGQWALAAVFGVTAGLGYVGASFGERRRTRHDVANRLRQGQFDDVRRIHARRQEEALRAHNLQLGISALIREAGQTPPAAATTLLARRVSDDQLGRPVFDRRPNRGLDIGQVLDVRYPTILAPGAVGTAIGLFVSPVVAAVQAGNTIVNTWINAMVESGYGDLDTHYTDLTSAQLAHASLVRSRQSDDRLLGGVHDLVWSALAGPGDTRPAVPGEVVADLVVAEPQAPIMPPFWRKIFPLTALLPGIGEFAAVSTLGSTVAAATGAGETAKDEVTTGSVNAVLTSITGTAGHYPLNWFRAGKQALQGYHRMAEGAIAEGKTKQRALRAVLDDDQHGNAAALGQLFTTEGRTVDNSAAVAEMTAGLFADGRTRALLELLTKLDGVEVDPADPLRVRVERDGRSRQLRFVVGDVENHAPAKWEADEDSVTVTVSRLLGDAVEVFPAVGHELREIGELLVGTPADGAHERGQETQLAVLGWVADQESEPKAGVRADLALLDTVTSLGLMPGTETERFALLEPELIPLIDRVASRVDVMEQDVAAVSLAPDAARPLRIAHNSWESALQGLGAQVGGLGSVVKALLPAQVGLGHYALNVTRQLFGFGAAGLTELISQGRGLQVMLIPPPDGYRTEDHLKADEVGWSDAMSDRTLAAWEEYLAAHPDQLPDVLHAHDGWMTRSAFDLADAYGVPVVLTVHATEIGRRGGRLDTDTSRSIHALEWRTVRRADHVIVNSPKMKEEAVAAFHLSPDRVTIIPNGTDPSRWKIDRATVDRDSARARLQAGPQDTVIYYQGRLAKEKGVQDLIAALPAVQRRYPDAKLRVVGDDTGEFAAELKQQVSALVTEGRLAAGDVVFLGRIGHAEGLPELVASADVGVIPSRYEPFGVVANELATAGLPLVASDQIGFVDQSNGLAYPAGAVDELVTAILGVLDDPAGAGRRAEAAREKALSPMYHWEVIAQQTVDVYRGIEAHQVRSPEEIGEVVYPGSGDGGHWYQSAVFYQALVRAYRDGDGDGYGDLRGLIEQLDYIELLGVDCLWLNPIYPSPLKDGGYDVSDYTDVHPSAGTLDDFKELLAEAHRRGIRIIVDFVPNHSSDQHPWFQESRRDPDGPYGDFYVWSDTPERFYTPLHTDPDGGEYIVDPDTGERRAIDPESTWLRITSASGQPLIGPRIIFTDTETSNWTWDPVRGQYFWHRFFGHQPDLNFENPAVQQAILDAQEFWLDLGVDGFRVDAVPYLYVREGTNGENLPETHAFVRRMRALSDRYDAMVLCEANQPLDDLMAYFGDPAKGGDGFQMAFDFALMPRLYMALASEVAEPIRELVRHRPALPASAALMTFLDNHDERTTEMVSNAEREYLHATYDPTHQRKSNDGFVGRLAPLLGNDPARIKLANGLLFALSGSPIIYYGDELGMGDNPALPDRDAQRTPMPWRPDRNAGFSVAAPYRPSNGDPDPRHLYLPPVTGSPDGFREVNVEHQLYDESSLLYWTRDLIGAYKQHPVLAVGTFTDLAGSNGHVLAFARQDGDEVVLGIFNLAGTTQATDLDLSAWAGRRPTDILGQQRFRAIDDLPYAVTLDGNGFYWLTLNRRAPE